MSLNYLAPPPSAAAEAKPSPKPYQRLLAMGDERVLAINNQLARGETPFAVARMIQQQWGEFQDLKEDTLAQQLRRYRDQHIDIVPDGTQVPTKNSAPVFARLAVTSHMIEIVMHQRERILDMIEAEKKTKGKHSASLKAEIESYMSLLKDVQKQQFDMGLDTLEGVATSRYQRGATQTTIAPDGSIVHTQVQEATTKALRTLDNFEVPAQ